MAVHVVHEVPQMLPLHLMIEEQNAVKASVGETLGVADGFDQLQGLPERLSLGCTGALPLTMAHSRQVLAVQ